MHVPAGYVQMSNMTSAAGLTSPPSQANAVLLQAEVQNVRWRDDGTPPTANSGMLLRTTDPPLLLEGVDVSKIEVIAAASGAVLNVAYYKPRSFTPV